MKKPKLTVVDTKDRQREEELEELLKDMKERLKVSLGNNLATLTLTSDEEGRLMIQTNMDLSYTYMLLNMAAQMVLDDASETVH